MRSLFLRLIILVGVFFVSWYIDEQIHHVYTFEVLNSSDDIFIIIWNEQLNRTLILTFFIGSIIEGLIRRTYQFSKIFEWTKTTYKKEILEIIGKPLEESEIYNLDSGAFVVPEGEIPLEYAEMYSEELYERFQKQLENAK